MPPDVSVVMAVYNGERFLPEAIESVLGQTLENLELIVVDDGSTDGTAGILREHAAADARVVVETQANAGRAAARNRGFGLARSPLVALLDADDVALPGRLEAQRRFLDAHEEVAAVGGAVAFVDDRGRRFAEWRYPLSHQEITNAFASVTPIAHSAAMIRRAAFDAAGGYRTLFAVSEDLDLWLRLGRDQELANVPELVLSYRFHADQASMQQLELQTLESLAARRSAGARRDGRRDPLDTVERIDHSTVRALGVGEREIATAFVRDATWLAKMMGKAGYTEASEELFLRARERARSGHGSPILAADVDRAHSAILRGRGQRVRAAVLRARAHGSALRQRLGAGHGDHPPQRRP